jgi:hypothetical protein
VGGRARRRRRWSGESRGPRRRASGKSDPRTSAAPCPRTRPRPHILYLFDRWFVACRIGVRTEPCVASRREPRTKKRDIPPKPLKKRIFFARSRNMIAASSQWCANTCCDFVYVFAQPGVQLLMLMRTQQAESQRPHASPARMLQTAQTTLCLSGCGQYRAWSGCVLRRGRTVYSGCHRGCDADSENEDTGAPRWCCMVYNRHPVDPGADSLTFAAPAKHTPAPSARTSRAVSRL